MFFFYNDKLLVVNFLVSRFDNTLKADFVVSHIFVKLNNV